MHKDKRIMNWQPFMNNIYCPMHIFYSKILPPIHAPDWLHLKTVQIIIFDDFCGLTSVTMKITRYEHYRYSIIHHLELRDKETEKENKKNLF